MTAKRLHRICSTVLAAGMIVLLDLRPGETAQFAAEFAPLHGRETDRGLEVTLNDASVDSSQAEDQPGATRDLERLVGYLKAEPTRKILIEGHTDAVGPSSDDVHRSQARANAVRAFLVRRGVDPDRITTVGYGAAFPVASNESADGRQQNRRAELTLLQPGEVASRHLRVTGSAVSGAPPR